VAVQEDFDSNHFTSGRKGLQVIVTWKERATFLGFSAVGGRGANERHNQGGVRESF